MSIGVSIVEDDGPAREILTDWIRHAHGFSCVSQYGSAESALMKLQAEKPSVVLMDINLPGMSGIECVRQLKPQLPQTQFVMLTVYEDTDHIFDALAVGASGYLLKQTPRAELLTALKEVHAGGSPMTSNIARKVVQSFLRPAPQVDESVILSPREREVLELLACGYLYKEIADNLISSGPKHLGKNFAPRDRPGAWSPGVRSVADASRPRCLRRRRQTDVRRECSKDF
jgi:DNA-binding NarL/FixJ family response regulator